MKNSTIKQHKQIGKELVPPFMQEPLGSIMHLCSWSKERLPEYIWIGIFYHLKEYMLKTLEEPTDKFSTILKLKREDKISLFEKIKEVFGDKVLDPIIIVSNFDKDLRDSFLDKSNTNNKRISKNGLCRKCRNSSTRNSKSNNNYKSSEFRNRKL